MSVMTMMKLSPIEVSRKIPSHESLKFKVHSFSHHWWNLSLPGTILGRGTTKMKKTVFLHSQSWHTRGGEVAEALVWREQWQRFTVSPGDTLWMDILSCPWWGECGGQVISLEDITSGKNSDSRRLIAEDIAVGLGRLEFSFFLLFLMKQRWAIQQGSLTISHKQMNPNHIASGVLLTRSSAFNYYK